MFQIPASAQSRPSYKKQEEVSSSFLGACNKDLLKRLNTYDNDFVKDDVLFIIMTNC